MYGAIREYTLQPNQIERVVRQVGDDFVPIISKAPGFVSYALMHVGPDEVVTASLFEHKAEAEHSVKLAADWVAATLTGAFTAPPRVTTGDVRVRHVADGAFAGYGVMRRFFIDARQSAESTKRVVDGLVPLLAAMPGFASYAMLLEESGDRGASLLAYRDRSTAEAAGERSMAWVTEHLGSMHTKPVEVIAGEIKVRHVRTAVAAR